MKMKTKKLDEKTECVLKGCHKPAKYQLCIGNDIGFCDYHFGRAITYNMEKLVSKIQRKIEIFVQEWGIDTKNKEELEKRIKEKLG